MKTRYTFLFVLLLATSFLFVSCSGVYDTITNIQRLKFKLGAVTNMKVAGIGINNKNSITDFNVLDAAKLLSAFSGGKLNTSFTLNLLAKNPNDGTGGTKNTTAIIKSIAWKLLIDDKDIINGNIGNSIEVPGVGKETTIPIDMSFDLLSFFKGDKYESLMNLALALGGSQGSSARLKLKIQPTVDTFLGAITYPGELTVIDKEFRSQ